MRFARMMVLAGILICFAGIFLASTPLVVVGVILVLVTIIPA